MPLVCVDARVLAIILQSGCRCICPKRMNAKRKMNRYKGEWCSDKLRVCWSHIAYAHNCTTAYTNFPRVYVSVCVGPYVQGCAFCYWVLLFGYVLIGIIRCTLFNPWQGMVDRLELVKINSIQYLHMHSWRVLENLALLNCQKMRKKYFFKNSFVLLVCWVNN